MCSSSGPSCSHLVVWRWLQYVMWCPPELMPPSSHAARLEAGSGLTPGLDQTRLADDGLDTRQANCLWYHRHISYHSCYFGWGKYEGWCCWWSCRKKKSRSQRSKMCWARLGVCVSSGGNLLQLGGGSQVNLHSTGHTPSLGLLLKSQAWVISDVFGRLNVTWMWEPLQAPYWQECGSCRL